MRFDECHAKCFNYGEFKLDRPQKSKQDAWPMGLGKDSFNWAFQHAEDPSGKN
jgi:hypothetical protein